ncbi:MAG: hypothetical protein ACK5G9_01920 [Akkermansiaceae bacterium]|jgi:hypothetical protein
MANDADSPAQAAYPKPFSRPPSIGETYDTWQNAKGPDVGKTSVDVSRLPSRVDNSTRPEFPPIYRQNGGACGQFTAIASIFTYEMNLLNGTHADTDATRFPADFSWNMVNRASNKNGSEAYHGWETAKHIGIPTVKTYGTVHRKEAGPWPNGYEIWREAMEYRVAGYRYTPANTVSQINEARGWLYDRNQPLTDRKCIGGLLALDGRMGEREKVTKKISEGQHQAGEELWTRWGPSGFGHGITCVGYDDKVGYDVNGDGKITNDIDTNNDGKNTLADWERGAFIVVNSWGKDWANKGKIYLLYSAMVDPTWERGNYLGRIEVARHIPQHTLKLKLSHNKRSDLRVSIGIAKDKNATQPENEMSPQHLNGWPLFGNRKNNVGEVPLAGPGDDTPLEIGIDLTPLFKQMELSPNPDARLFLNFSNENKSDAIGTLHTCAIRSYDNNGKFVRESTVVISDGNIDKTPLLIETSLHNIAK